MVLCKVTGNVVSTIKIPALMGYKILITHPVDPEGRLKGKSMLALDMVQAGAGDTVLVMDEGNSARIIVGDSMAPFRTVIVGIVDEVNYDRSI